MLTINAEIKSDGKRIDGTYNVKLRFTLNRKMKPCSNFVAALILAKKIYHRYRISHLLTIFATNPRHSGG